jgi:putative endonuclease
VKVRLAALGGSLAGGQPNFYYPVDRIIVIYQYRGMFYYVYVLQSDKTDELYKGYTKDLRVRLKQHNNGLNFSTRSYLPWQLIHYEAYLNEQDAKRREKYLKTSQGGRLLKRMLKEYFYENKKKK